MKSAQNEKLVLMVRTGLLAALICLLTALLHIPTPNGYIHCGDAVIFLAAATLPLPYAVAAAAFGGAMADFLTGYAAYILPTFLIKGAIAAVFSKIGGSALISRRRVMACVVCGIISIMGYYAAAVILYGNAAAQILETVPANLVQAAASSVLYFAIARVTQPT